MEKVRNKIVLHAPYSKAQCCLFKQNPANKFRFDTKFEQIK